MDIDDYTKSLTHFGHNSMILSSNVKITRSFEWYGFWYRVFHGESHRIRKVQMLCGKRWRRIPFKRVHEGVIFKRYGRIG
jgi:hypothetical protein